MNRSPWTRSTASPGTSPAPATPAPARRRARRQDLRPRHAGGRRGRQRRPAQRPHRRDRGGLGHGGGGHGVGSGQRLPAQGAAFVNAFQIHCLEYDSVHEGAVVHAMATLLSAVAAQAERRGGVTGRDLIAAVAAGVDVAAALGLAAKGGMTFFRPATAGAFGAVAALGSVEGLAPDALVNVFGIVGGHACGTMQAHTEGSRLLPAQIAFNARGALTALDLAAAGLAGPREVLEGHFGYFRLFESGAWDLGPVLADLGRVWQITRVSTSPFRAAAPPTPPSTGCSGSSASMGSPPARSRACAPPCPRSSSGWSAAPTYRAPRRTMRDSASRSWWPPRSSVAASTSRTSRRSARGPRGARARGTGRRRDRRATLTRTRSCRSGSKSCSTRERAMSWCSRAPSGTRRARSHANNISRSSAGAGRTADNPLPRSAASD